MPQCFPGWTLLIFPAPKAQLRESWALLWEVTSCYGLICWSTTNWIRPWSVRSSRNIQLLATIYLKVQLKLGSVSVVSRTPPLTHIYTYNLYKIGLVSQKIFWSFLKSFLPWQWWKLSDKRQEPQLLRQRARCRRMLWWSHSGALLSAGQLK